MTTMTDRQIARKYQSIKKKMAVLESDLKELRSACPHNDVKEVYLSDTGNYDLTHDRYWVEYTCPHCGRFWTEDR